MSELVTETAARSRGGRYEDVVIREVNPRLHLVKRSYLSGGEVVKEKYLVQRDKTGPGQPPWSRYEQMFFSSSRAAERSLESSAVSPGERPFWWLSEASSDWFLR